MILKRFNRILTNLLDGQLQQRWQAGCQHPNEEWGGGAADVQHAGRQHRHKGMLPGEGVQQRQHCMATPRQHTTVNRGGEKRLDTKTLFSSHTDHMTPSNQS